MSEDRHSFSDPRLAPGLSGGDLAWEVDVFRKGVEGPVDTLRVDDSNLPPRVNKKGKVVWRLPSDKSRLPSFGADEKRRIMELYKEHRKNRKKSSKATTASVSVSSDDSNSNKNSGGDGSVCQTVDADAPDPVQTTTSSTKKKNKKKKKQLQRQLSASSADEDPPNDAKTDASTGADSVESSKRQPPPGFHLPSMELWNDENSSLPNDENTDTTPPPSETDHPKQDFENQEESRLAPSSTSRYVLIPERDRPPQTKENTSLAVAAAKAFVDLYYPHITHGLSSDLAMHYTPHAQKSVSVGGAHSVVQGRNSIALQIASLSGSVFVVRGVVSQDTVEGLGAHILVTGIMLPQQQQQHQTTPFCHSISLVPAKHPDSGQTIPYAFQVHNDALSLLSGDMIAAAVNPQQAPYQQQQPQQHHPAPETFSTTHMHPSHYQQTMKQPPGLFG